ILRAKRHKEECTPPHAPITHHPSPITHHPSIKPKENRHPPTPLHPPTHTSTSTHPHLYIHPPTPLHPLTHTSTSTPFLLHSTALVTPDNFPSAQFHKHRTQDFPASSSFLLLFLFLLCCLFFPVLLLLLYITLERETEELTCHHPHNLNCLQMEHKKHENAGRLPLQSSALPALVPQLAE